MTWIVDAHDEWHHVNGWANGCPLDCIDYGMEEEDYEEVEHHEERQIVIEVEEAYVPL